jgi:hypothetical protein
MIGIIARWGHNALLAGVGFLTVAALIVFTR